MNRKMSILAYVFGVVAVLAVMLAGCHSGGGGSAPPPTKATSKGVITGFGSVFVNGVEYDSASSSVSMDGVSATESDLQIGMVVTVSGSIDPSGTTGTATNISFADSLEGPVSSVFSAASGTLVVMGQTVRVDGTTTYQNVNDASLLALDDMVEVSGFPDATGAILATLIEKKSTLFTANSTTVELKGLVSGLTGSVFSINALSIDASGVALPGGLADGSYVEVRGTLAAAGGPMTATFLELEQLFSADEGEHVEVEGIVTDYVSMSSFKVNGVPVDGSALSATYADGMMVEVEGTMAGGVLVAGEGEVEQESDILLEGDVTAVGPGSLTVLGQTATVTATTEYRDSSATNLHTFGFADVTIGDHVEIVGYPGTGGGVVATRIERFDASAQAQMQGIVSAATTTSLTILGVLLDTSSASFRDIDSNPMLAADFFTAIRPGTTVVKVQWNTFTITSEPVDEAELESVP